MLWAAWRDTDPQIKTTVEGQSGKEPLTWWLYCLSAWLTAVVRRPPEDLIEAGMMRGPYTRHLVAKCGTFTFLLIGNKALSSSFFPVSMSEKVQTIWSFACRLSALFYRLLFYNFSYFSHRRHQFKEAVNTRLALSWANKVWSVSYRRTRIDTELALWVHVSKDGLIKVAIGHLHKQATTVGLIISVLIAK